MRLKKGGKYNFISQDEILVYLGKFGAWHQFARIDRLGIWAEVLDSDLNLLEEYKDKL